MFHDRNRKNAEFTVSFLKSMGGVEVKEGINGDEKKYTHYYIILKFKK